MPQSLGTADLAEAQDSVRPVRGGDWSYDKWYWRLSLHSCLLSSHFDPGILINLTSLPVCVGAARDGAGWERGPG